MLTADQPCRVVDKVNVGRLVTTLAPRGLAGGPKTVSPLKDGKSTSVVMMTVIQGFRRLASMRCRDSSCARLQKGALFDIPMLLSSARLTMPSRLVCLSVCLSSIFGTVVVAREKDRPSTLVAA